MKGAFAQITHLAADDIYTTNKNRKTAGCPKN